MTNAELNRAIRKRILTRLAEDYGAYELIDEGSSIIMIIPFQGFDMSVELHRSDNSIFVTDTTELKGKGWSKHEKEKQRQAVKLENILKQHVDIILMNFKG